MGTTIRSAGDDTHSPIRALHSLNQVQAVSILAGLVSLPTSWTIESHESCDGHLSLVVSNAAEDTTLLVGQDAGGIYVGFMVGDELLSSQARYSSIKTAVCAVTALIGSDNITTARNRIVRLAS